MGPVSAAKSLVALDDRPIDGAAGPAARSYCAGEQVRHEEREEKGEGPRGSERTENGASMTIDVAQYRRLALDRQQCVKWHGSSAGGAYGAAS
jgi:hypothetical protein